MREHPTPLRRGEPPLVKAGRLIRENRVRLAPSVQVYLVEGDTKNYAVIATGQGIHCPCEARTPLCAHVLAVAQVRERERLTVAPDPADLEALWRAPTVEPGSAA